MKTAIDHQVTFYGMEHEQYFQGHGISFTSFTDCATGIGNNALEALEDALESLAQNGWDTEKLEADIFSSCCQELDRKRLKLLDVPSDCDDVHYYVGLRVK